MLNKKGRQKKIMSVLYDSAYLKFKNRKKYSMATEAERGYPLEGTVTVMQHEGTFGDNESVFIS